MPAVEVSWIRFALDHICIIAGQREGYLLSLGCSVVWFLLITVRSPWRLPDMEIGERGFMSLVFPIIGSMGEHPDWAALVGRRSSVWVWRALGLRAGILPLVTGADSTTSHPVSVGLPFQRWGGRDFRGPCWFLTTALFLFVAVLGRAFSLFSYRGIWSKQHNFWAERTFNRDSPLPLQITVRLLDIQILVSAANRW